jgi:serine protease AprX
VAAALIAPSAALADASLSPGLAERAQANPDASFRVIVQGTRGRRTSGVNETVLSVPSTTNRVKRQFSSVNGVAAQLTGRQILLLAEKPLILSITEDIPVQVTSGNSDNYSNRQRWPYVSRTAKFWQEADSSGSGSGLEAPTIAIVDSGVDASRADFDGRVVAQVRMTNLLPNAPGDGRGHGTFVASIAAGEKAHYAGAVPNADIVSIDVTDDNGMAMTSDVIAACDWILQHKSQYGIRVANFSLHSSQRSTFRFDPLNRAVEKLWFSGVVVVAASGNYGESESGVNYSPANDPFVITVGAMDISGSTGVHDDFAAPWSAHGSTPDGFAKPDLGAPGRYMVGAVSSNTTLARERPDRIVAPGYMMISGTSFAAPVVAGAAAYVLAEHPNWTPDQVKGALLLTARPTPSAAPGSSGVGEVDAAAAARASNPANPNLALNAFKIPDPAGGPIPVFDQATWTTAAQLNPLWDAATWTTAWTNATWTTATWTTATWVSATWTSATWTTATWTTAHNDATWTTSAETEANAANGEWIDPDELEAEEAELGLGD